MENSYRVNGGFIDARSPRDPWEETANEHSRAIRMRAVVAELSSRPPLTGISSPKTIHLRTGLVQGVPTPVHLALWAVLTSIPDLESTLFLEAALDPWASCEALPVRADRAGSSLGGTPNGKAFSIGGNRLRGRNRRA